MSSPEISLAGKTAVITGAAGGLGKAISSVLHAAGANVVLADKNTKMLESTAAEFSSTKSSARVLAVTTNVTCESSIGELFVEAVKEFGKVDIVVNNAGMIDNFHPVGTMEKDLWDHVIAVNLTGTYLMSKAAVNHMIEEENGEQRVKNGIILNISSVSGSLGFRAGKYS